jgi:phage gpG-like protein
VSEPITVQISGEASALLARVEKLDSILRVAARVIRQQNALTVGHIQEHKLSERGPTTLGVVTNRLRRSARATRPVIDGEQILSSIGTNVRYAGVHEFGFDGEVSVKAHTRKAAERFMIDNGRRSVTRNVAQRLGLLRKDGKPRKGAATPVHQDNNPKIDVKTHMR